MFLHSTLKRPEFERQLRILRIKALKDSFHSQYTSESKQHLGLSAKLVPQGERKPPKSF